jgi:4a-hydroxytetrahydrobiopterin dehydratase
MAVIDSNEIEAFLEAHPGWTFEGTEITREYRFSDFNEAMGFVTQVGLVAAKADHHPDIDIRWNKVTLTLSTHSEGGLTVKDLDMADMADRIV